MKRIQIVQLTVSLSLIATISLLQFGCASNDRGYLAYKHMANDADVYLLVQDESGNPIEGVTMYCHITIPDWPDKDPDPFQCFREYETELISDTSGRARFRQKACISVIVIEMKKPGYAWIRPTLYNGLPSNVKFGYSNQAIATGDFIETSADKPYILRMKQAKED